MRIATVRLQNQATGRTIIVNEADYSRDLGGWAGWRRVGESRGEADTPIEVSTDQSSLAELKARATELGIRFHGNIKAEKLAAKIDDATKGN